ASWSSARRRPATSPHTGRCRSDEARARDPARASRPTAAAAAHLARVRVPAPAAPGSAALYHLALPSLVGPALARGLAQSQVQSGSGVSPSPGPEFGAPTAITSAPSGPALLPRITCGRT